ncbi:MAG: DUF2914 domain-containing protein [Rhodothermia bacterium]|nr:DUF2914 domain-containing protein [Rhodothermia bacterium]
MAEGGLTQSGPDGSTDTGVHAIARRLLQSPLIKRGRRYAENHRHVVAAAFFFGGFIWDLLTLQRIDAWFDNLLLSLYLVALTGLILLSARAEYGDAPDGRVSPALGLRRNMIRDALQFLMGALFSAFVVFYGQSASLGRTSAYLALLVILLIANEFVHRRNFNLTLLISLYFLASASFLIFFLPVVLVEVGYGSFLAACIISAVLALGLSAAVRRRCMLPDRRLIIKSLVSILILGLLLNFFYLTNLIPPVPIAMKFGGVYHNVYRDGEAYHLWYETPPWYRLWSRTSNPFHYREGEAVYCFAAVFAPTDFEQEVYHTWEYLEDSTGDWVQTDRIGYEVVGGRDGGFRGFTVKREIQPGEWRVRVEDERGLVLGKISFEVIPVGDRPPRISRHSYY